MSIRNGPRPQPAGRRRIVAGITLVLVCLPAATSAQSTARGSTRVRADTARPAPVQLFRWRFVGEVAVGTAASLVLLPFDGRMRAWAQDPVRQRSSPLDHVASALMPLGSGIPLAAAGVVYGIGRLAHRPTVADIGLHVAEAMAGAGVSTVFLKVVVGRARPYVEPHDPHAFGKGRPFAFDGSYESFPSGHATEAFALASALTEETALHWPGRQRVVGPVTYLLATGVAFARVYRDKHWASDVVGGAVVGTLVGRRVVESLHTGGAGPFSRIQPILLPHDLGMSAGLRVVLR
jgi:membrane-associated phospholipid phosphatase